MLLFNKMTNEQQQEYKEQVERSFAIFDNRLIRLKAWEHADLKEYHRGAELCAAFQNYLTTANLALRENGRRYVATIHKYLAAIRNKTELVHLREIHANDPRKFIAAVPMARVDENGDEIQAAERTAESYITPFEGRRPEHLSQYIDVLSPELQALVNDPVKGMKQLFLERAYNHEQMAALDAQGASAADVAEFSAAVCECDDALRELFARIDGEWERLSAEVKASVVRNGGGAIEFKVVEPIHATEVLDANGQTLSVAEAEAKSPSEATVKSIAQAEAIAKSSASTMSAGASSTHVVTPEEAAAWVPSKKNELPTKLIIDAMPEGEARAAWKMKRMESNRKYLRRTDVNMTEQRRAEIQLRRSELEAWGVDVSEYKICAE